MPFWITNLVLFNSAWFVCALATPYAIWVLPVLIGLHFLLSPSRNQDLLLLMLAPFGWLLDQLLFFVDVFESENNLMPAWLLMLWCLFILTLNHAMTWLTRLKYTSVGLLGAIFGPLSYFAGIQAGALKAGLSDTPLLIVLASAWAVFLPALVAGKKHLFVKVSV